jgi:type IV secretory pathway VirB2 component (pilin)
MNTHLKKIGSTLLLWWCGLESALATTTNLPFTTVMDKLKEAITGTVAFDIAIIMITVSCLMLGFGEWGDGVKRTVQFTFFCGIALASGNMVNALFGTSGALC